MEIRHQTRLVQTRAGDEIVTIAEEKVPGGLVLGRIVRDGKPEIEPYFEAADLRTVTVLLPPVEGRE